MHRLDRLHLEYPFAGSRMLRGLLAAEGCKIGRPHVRTLMRRMGIEALYRRPRTTTPESGHKIYRYLLRGLHRRCNRLCGHPLIHLHRQKAGLERHPGHRPRPANTDKFSPSGVIRHNAPRRTSWAVTLFRGIIRVDGYFCYLLSAAEALYLWLSQPGSVEPPA